jgi:hypothetical protein
LKVASALVTSVKPLPSLAEATVREAFPKLPIIGGDNLLYDHSVRPLLLKESHV